MRMLKAALLILLIGTLAGFRGCERGTPDGETPATSGVCDELHEATPGLFGLCVAFCEAQGCEASFVEATGELVLHQSCASSNRQIFANYNRQRGPSDPDMPCVNLAPVADAGPDQTDNVLVADAVILDGSASWDPDGGALGYLWTLESAPTDSNAELSDASSETAAFVADVVGTYVVRLVVNDGWADSAPDDVRVRVAVPPPVVTIERPLPLSLVTTSPVTVTGTVSDPLATVAVGGAPTTNDDGSFSAEVALADGHNTVTVLATNGTGDGSASVEVILKRLPDPVMRITSHQTDFTVGLNWDGCGPVPDAIPTVVVGTIVVADGMSPTVMVNGEAATVDALGANPALVGIYGFSATILLEKGLQTIEATGTDGGGRSRTVAVVGVADICQIAEPDTSFCEDVVEPGSLPALRGTRQNNVCHAIDGCSTPIGGDDSDAFRNQPMPNAIYYTGPPVRFGSGTRPPSEFFVHGLAPRKSLGCNIHDTCYQTCVPAGGGARLDAWAACNAEQYFNHLAECRRAYPDVFCPFRGLEVYKCPRWLSEKVRCSNLANVVYSALTVLGLPAYLERQEQYCLE